MSCRGVTMMVACAADVQDVSGEDANRAIDFAESADEPAVAIQALGSFTHFPPIRGNSSAAVTRPQLGSGMTKAMRVRARQASWPP